MTTLTYDPAHVLVARRGHPLEVGKGDVWSSNPSRLEIGTFTQAPGQTARKGYEVAAWYTEVALTPGVYPVTTNGYYAFVAVPGEVVSAYTASLFCGVAFGDDPQYDRHRDVGQATTYHRQMYLYDCAAAMADPESPFTPAPGVVPVLRGWCEHRWSHGNHASPMFGLHDHREAA